MKIKLGKLLTVVALATGVAIGAFVDSAEAGRGTGARPSGSRGADIGSDYDFEVFELDDFGNPRILNGQGTFTQVIEKFNLFIEDRDDVFLFDEEEIFNETLDLTPRFVPASSTISLLDGTQIPISPSFRETGFRRGEVLFGVEINTITNLATTQNNRIEYTFTGSSLNDIDIEELTLFIDNPDSSIDLNLAVNNISYIIDNNLLGSINGYRVSGLSNSDTNGIQSIIFSEDEADNVSTQELFIDPNIEQKVPEASNIAGLLTLGALGTSLLLRKSNKSC